MDKWLAEIDSEFELILILEDLDTSLALLVLKFCWEVRDVVHLKLNSMTKEKHQLTSEDARRLQEFLWADNTMYVHYKMKLQQEIEHYGKDLVDGIKEEIIKESHQLSDECLDRTVVDNNSFMQRVAVRPSKSTNQTCYILTQQEQMVQHLQIEQIIRWKKQYPAWRMTQTKDTPGNDVPSFCHDNKSWPHYHTNLANTEKIKNKWGFWRFVQMPTNEFDIKQHPSAEIQWILKTYPSEIHSNTFIYNDPIKPHS